MGLSPLKMSTRKSFINQCSRTRKLVSANDYGEAAKIMLPAIINALPSRKIFRNMKELNICLSKTKGS
jgi:hypothetical protein